MGYFLKIDSKVTCCIIQKKIFEIDKKCGFDWVTVNDLKITLFRTALENSNSQLFAG